jgi:hypothetical protein
MSLSLANVLLQAGAQALDSTAAVADSLINSEPVQQVAKTVEEFSILDLLGK